MENQELELFYDIPEYEGYYKISKSGIVKSLNYKRTNKEQILKSHPDANGYLQLRLCKNNTQKMIRIHQLVA